MHLYVAARPPANHLAVGAGFLGDLPHSVANLAHGRKTARGRRGAPRRHTPVHVHTAVRTPGKTSRSERSSSETYCGAHRKQTTALTPEPSRGRRGAPRRPTAMQRHSGARPQKSSWPARSSSEAYPRARPYCCTAAGKTWRRGAHRRNTADLFRDKPLHGRLNQLVVGAELPETYCNASPLWRTAAKEIVAARSSSEEYPSACPYCCTAARKIPW
jgi:hypothetical protein